MTPPQNTTHRTPDHAARGGVPVIGVTGAPAAGKSTVTGFLAAAGCTVIDVDRLGHAALELDPVRARVVAEFGAGVVRSDGHIDRAALAAAAFRDPIGIARLEALVHPVVRERLGEEIAAAREASPRAIVIDAALLFEGTLHTLCDVTCAVDAAQAIRTERARVDRNWAPGELERRQARQLAPSEKRTRADHVIENDGDLAALRVRTLCLLEACAPRDESGADDSASNDCPSTARFNTHNNTQDDTNDTGR